MTTYVFFDGLLAADTRVSAFTPQGTVEEIGCMNKIRATLLRAMVGSGRKRLVFSLLFLPNLLALRWLGWTVFPTFPDLRDGEGVTLCVAWRHGPFWVFSAQVRRRWGMCLATRTDAFLSNHRHPQHGQPSIMVNARGSVVAKTVRTNGQLVSSGGSGARTLSSRDIARLGAPRAIALAAERDPATNAHATVFDTRRWSFTDRSIDAPAPEARPAMAAVWGAGLLAFLSPMLG